MITQSEREWLVTHRTYCNYCDLECGSDDCEWEMAMEQCAMFPRMKDALEFSERVAAKLARQAMKYVCEKYPCRHGRPALGCMRDNTKLTGPYAVHCEDCFLREARLQVEEEMDD